MKGFQSGVFLRAKLEKAKALRIEDKCKCKLGILKKCNCGKLSYPDLNIHEKQVVEILDIKNIEEEELVKCARWLEEFKQGEKSSDENESWLYTQVRQLTLCLKIKKTRTKSCP